MDNFTNAIMLNIAYTDNGPAFESAFAGYRHSFTDSPLSDLNSYVGQGDTGHIFSYPRYWHGWLIVLRPLLTILNLQA